MNIPNTYELIEERKLSELNSDGLILKHKKTGAKLVLMKNDDENKVFYIGFRTPPVDSTGAAHIVEHSVLCGSRKYPVKDPFVELVKGSLNTFLNAMTYPDKTVYPVASCNDKDFKNLMDVYLDAVLYPNIYREEKIFMQEGWHYELESKEDELTLNGVVYNEMKGAFSSPDDVFSREVFNSLYPDISYGYESGGDPDVIPELSYEKFLDFHRRYYHPSNSYIYLYGNMDMEERLTYLDREYLSKFDRLDIDSNPGWQKPFETIREVEKEYPVLEGDSMENSTYLSLNKVVGDVLDKELYLAFQILDYALCSAPGAPLKEALIHKNIGKDVYSVYEEGVRQPYFSIVAKNANYEQREEFLVTIKEVLEGLCEKGLDKKSLYAGLNIFEFRHREADFGSYPKGLAYGLTMLDSWLHDERNPFTHVEANETFALLRKRVESDYYENLIRTYLLDNSYGSIMILKPKQGLMAKKDEELAGKLAKYKEKLTENEINHIIDNTRALREYQETEDSEEKLACIPRLEREDVKKEAEPFINELRQAGNTRVLFHDVFTNGIGYLRFLFDCSAVSEEYYPYLGIMKNVLGLISTKNYSYADFYNEINLATGGMTCVSNTFINAHDLKEYRITFDIKTKVLYKDIPKALTLISDMIKNTIWEDHGRILELLEEEKAGMQTGLLSAGHSTAMGRALSYLSEAGALNDVLNGIDHYRLLEELTSNYEEKKGELCRKLKELSELLFTPAHLMVDYTAEEAGYEGLPKLLEEFTASLFPDKKDGEKYHPVPKKKNEGFLSASQVQYVCRAGNYIKRGLPYTGALKVLRVMLGFDYLWNEVRVKGGAYGCLCSFGRTGESFFVSYRDPNLEKTIEAYKQAADYVAGYEGDEETLTQYVIGAIGTQDTPKSPQMKGLYGLSAYMTGITFDEIQRERDEILQITPEILRGLSAYIRAFMGDECICVLGKEEKITEAKELFLKREVLIQS